MISFSASFVSSAGNPMLYLKLSCACMPLHAGTEVQWLNITERYLESLSPHRVAVLFKNLTSGDQALRSSMHFDQDPTPDQMRAEVMRAGERAREKLKNVLSSLSMQRKDVVESWPEAKLDTGWHALVDQRTRQSEKEIEIEMALRGVGDIGSVVQPACSLSAEHAG